MLLFSSDLLLMDNINKFTINKWILYSEIKNYILEWVAISFSNESSRPGDQTRVSHIAGSF